MRLALRFLGRTLAWTSGFMALVLLSALLRGESGDVQLLQLTRSVIGALIFATFPAGIGVARDAISWSRPRLGPPLAIALAAGLVALLVVLIRGYAVPALVRAGDAPESAAAAAEAEAASMYFHERPRVLRQAVAAVEAAAETSVDAWVPVNRIAWELDGTVVSGLLALALAWIGVLVGVWSHWTNRRELRQAQYWALGLFLLTTTYLMAENSYELLLLRMAGPAFFAAWFPLIAPAMLLFGLTIATASRLLGASVKSAARVEAAV